VDMNVMGGKRPINLHPVENIYFKNPPGGQYKFFVRKCHDNTDPTKWPGFTNPKRSVAFKVYLTRDGKTTDKAGTIKNHGPFDCFKFTIAGDSSEAGTGGGGSYIVFPPGPSNATFKDLCAKYKVEWKVGSGYYAVARSEKIHNGKQMLLQNTKTDKFTVGRDKVLKQLGWPDSELKKGPKDLPADHMLFVQSTSYNRVIPPGTHVLFEVTPAEHAKHKKVNAAALKAAQQAAKSMTAGGAGGAAAKASAKAAATPKAGAKASPAPKAGAKRAASPGAAAPAPKRAAGGGGGISGKAIVFTGTLSTPRAAATAAAKAAGASVLGAVSSSTQILVAGPGAGSKMAKAQAMGIQVWDEAKFKKAVGL